ncbi:hypothetical protein [Liquorilactobacillus hordei]|uniref:Uncharacterized protein n=1 Tax=Liquorilactobacillus hordei DSM 19519 TaxID=1423759 RepID=A0A0R1M9R3_9LACO|nr:hypothetical protein [Liquorilactobacillus hordei]KRL04912.1 hypothetical protein FC92_GL001744 [Liquorilactobacillus hordei DSM 19519]QYH51638.1 hypothetical protein G6O70_03705 [Liquorilactobacillus hordei DSM 19519]
MLENQCLCWFKDTLFTSFYNDELVYLSKKMSKKKLQVLDRITEMNEGGFDFFYFDNVPFTDENLLVVPNPHNTLQFFIFNYVKKNDLLFVKTLDIKDYLGVLEHLEEFKNKLDLIIVKEGY